MHLKIILAQVQDLLLPVTFKEEVLENKIKKKLVMFAIYLLMEIYIFRQLLSINRVHLQFSVVEFKVKN